MQKELKQKLYLNIALVVIGLVLIIIHWVCDTVHDGTFTGMGGGFLIVGILRIVQICKILKRDEEALKKFREDYDERTVMIYNKAMSMTMRICLMALVFVTVVMFLLEKTFVAWVILWILFGCMAVYIISYVIYSKKM